MHSLHKIDMLWTADAAYIPILISLVRRSGFKGFIPGIILQHKEEHNKSLMSQWSSCNMSINITGVENCRSCCSTVTGSPSRCVHYGTPLNIHQPFLLGIIFCSLEHSMVLLAFRDSVHGQGEHV